MKPSLIVTGFVALMFNSSILAQSGLEQELVGLTAQRKKDIATATAPINQRYVERLDQLLKRATQSNQLELAIKIKQLMQSTGADTTEAATIKFAGTKWKLSGIGNVVEFSVSGDFHETITKEHVDLRGNWKAIGESEVVVTRNDNNTFHFVIAPDGQSITRREMGLKWLLAK